MACFSGKGEAVFEKAEDRVMIRRLVNSLGICRTCTGTEHTEPLWWNQVLILCELLKLLEHWLYRRHSAHTMLLLWTEVW